MAKGTKPFKILFHRLNNCSYLWCLSMQNCKIDLMFILIVFRLSWRTMLSLVLSSLVQTVTHPMVEDLVVCVLVWEVLMLWTWWLIYPGNSSALRYVHVDCNTGKYCENQMLSYLQVSEFSRLWVHH